jgi:hypothetical protein
MLHLIFWCYFHRGLARRWGTLALVTLSRWHTLLVSLLFCRTGNSSSVVLLRNLPVLLAGVENRPSNKVPNEVLETPRAVDGLAAHL